MSKPHDQGCKDDVDHLDNGDSDSDGDDDGFDDDGDDNDNDNAGDDEEEVWVAEEITVLLLLMMAIMEVIKLGACSGHLDRQPHLHLWR